MSFLQLYRPLAAAVVSVLMFTPSFAQSPAPDAAQPAAAQPSPEQPAGAPAAQAPASSTAAPQEGATAPSSSAAAPAPAQTAGQPQSSTPPRQEPAATAADVQGLDVFSSEGQQVGKVVAVNHADGLVKSIDVQSNGFFGFFKKTYVIPYSAVKKNGAKVELTMTSQEATSKLK